MQMYLITVKVAGGMRIVQHKHEKGDNQSREEKKEQEEEYGTVWVYHAFCEQCFIFFQNPDAIDFLRRKKQILIIDVPFLVIIITW